MWMQSGRLILWKIDIVENYISDVDEVVVKSKVVEEKERFLITNCCVVAEPQVFDAPFNTSLGDLILV